ncbi:MULTISPECIES: hypothetical protein [unclassified Acidovorax]|uniref:hypothetical protein n=1 Tax=unclassified Acidovorax TaxID=2684926 RepID=UPI0028834448|nr:MULTISPECIES: hypothetical protein [unclassified Acidovorax]
MVASSWIEMMERTGGENRRGKQKTAGLFSFGGCQGVVLSQGARLPLIRQGQRTKTKSKTRYALA